MERLAVQAAAVVTSIEATVDLKVSHVLHLKSEIKQKNIPESAVAPIFECLRLCLQSNNTSLALAGFSTFGHFWKRLILQGIAWSFAPLVDAIAAAVVARLNDENGRIRNAATETLSNLQHSDGPGAQSAATQSEVSAPSTTLGPEPKIAAEEIKAPAKKEAEETPNEEAVNAPAAKIAAPKIAAPKIAAPKIAAPKTVAPEAVSTKAVAPEAVPTKVPATKPTRPAAPAAPATPAAPGVEPRNVSSRHELEELIQSLVPCFEGKETDKNWQRREQNVAMLRRITHGNAPRDFNNTYSNIMKATTMIDNIFKVALSPRTNLQTIGLAMVQSLVQVNGPALDSVLDILMTNCLSLCGNTKKITSANGRKTVNFILENLTCSSRVVFHIAGAAASGNTNLRLFSAEWFQIIISRQAGHRLAGDALERMDLSIKNGVSDSKEDTRVAYRATFWDFYKVWPDNATHILDTLQPKHRQMIEKHPGNPMKDTFVSSSKPAPTGLYKSTPGRPTARGTTTTTNPTSTTTRGTTAATRPTRVNHITTTAATQNPTSTQAEAADISRPRKKLRPALTGTGTGTPASSLASAPMRPTKKPRVPQLTQPARPATAAGLHRRQPMESPNRGSPTRVPASNRGTPKASSQGVTRPRQKSDPLQDASPTKFTQHNNENLATDEVTPDRSLGNLNVPKTRRSNNNAKATVVASGSNENALASVAERIASHRWPSQEHLQAWRENAARNTTNEKDEAKTKPNYKQLSELFPFGVAGDITTIDTIDTTDLEGLPGNYSRGSRSRSVSSAKSDTSKTGDREQDGDMSDDEDDDLILTRLRSNDSASLGREATDAPTPAWVHPPRMNISLRSRDIVQARKMLADAIEKIQKKEMELGGYRKLQGLIEFHKWALTEDQAQFDALLSALLDELESWKPRSQIKKNVTEWDHKTQVLYTIKYLFVYMRTKFWSHNCETVVRLLRVQRPGAHRHFSNTIEQTIDEIIEVCEPIPMIDAVLVALDTDQTDPEHGARRKGLDVIAHCMTFVNGANRTLTEEAFWRIGQLVGSSLRTGSTAVRRRVMAVLIEMRPMVPDENEYWTYLGAPVNGMKALLAYYQTKERFF